jgi:hypothetical protein
MYLFLACVPLVLLSGHYDAHFGSRGKIWFLWPLLSEFPISKLWMLYSVVVHDLELTFQIHRIIYLHQEKFRGPSNENPQLLASSNERSPNK